MSPLNTIRAEFFSARRSNSHIWRPETIPASSTIKYRVLYSCLDLLILQKPLNGYRVLESNFLQFLNSADRRGNGKNLSTGFLKPSMQFPQSGSFAGPGSARYIHGSVARSQYKLNCMLLFRIQTVGNYKSVTSTQMAQSHQFRD